MSEVLPSADGGGDSSAEAAEGQGDHPQRLQVSLLEVSVRLFRSVLWCFQLYCGMDGTAVILFVKYSMR